jgi:hypothetical protein
MNCIRDIDGRNGKLGSYHESMQRSGRSRGWKGFMGWIGHVWCCICHIRKKEHSRINEGERNT